MWFIFLTEKFPFPARYEHRYGLAYVPPKKKSVHVTQHTSNESMLPMFLFLKETCSVRF